MKLSELTAYEVLMERGLPDINSVGYVLRHRKSGARITAISNDDENKVFYIGFRTPPENSTGVPHIIEHTVLCGSEKYPVKDPFVELVKGSLNTFLNAITYPDKTIYPVASCNRKDFQNLMSVYMDAVFHPNIYKYEEIFRQEGWHYEMESGDAPVTINGVVYNEMKGAFSSPDDVLQREILGSLFPDTCYRNESGGDPEHIPELDYEEYLDFHRKYYHPTNSYIYLYGDMDIAEKLQWMDEEYLSGYDRVAVDSEIRIQKAFDAPVELHRKYPVASGESTEARAYLSWNMVTGSVLDKTLYQAFDVLDYALLNAPGAPLKQALLDAGIGKDIVGGYDSSVRQPFFSIIARNTEISEKDRFLSVIREVLAQQVKNGINKKALLAGINSSEFRFREADYGQFPKGLLYGIQCLDSWLHDDMQPFMHLEAIETYRFLREAVQGDYFEKLIEEYLLDNPHASVITVEPQRGLSAEREAALEKKLALYRESLTEDEIAQLVADTKRLKAYQEEPSPKEDLEKIPVLKREDIRTEAAPLCNHVRDEDGTTFVHHGMFSGGIDYLTLLFDIRDIRPEELPYLGLLKSVLGYVDTADYRYADLANEINIHTGGIGSSVGIYPCYGKEDGAGDSLKFVYEVRTKVLSDRLPEAMRLIRGILLTSDVSDEKRLYEIVAQQKSRLETALSSSGHSVASTRALSYLSRAAYYQDAVSGIGCFRMLEEYEAHFEEKKAELASKLAGMMRRIFTADRLLVSITCEEKDYAAVRDEVLALRRELPVPEGGNPERVMPEFELQKKNEGFLDASQVQYVARAGNFAAHGYAYHGALKILKVIMGYDYLWLNVRVMGGAYGCMNSYMRNGDTFFVSYRDPNLGATNRVFEGIPEYLAQFEADERDMTKYIIGTMSNIDQPMTPAIKGERSMNLYMNKVSADMIREERSQILDAGQEDIRALARVAKAVLKADQFCVIGSEEKIEENRDMFGTVTRF